VCDEPADKTTMSLPSLLCVTFLITAIWCMFISIVIALAVSEVRPPQSDSIIYRAYQIIVLVVYLGLSMLPYLVCRRLTRTVAGRVLIVLMMGLAFYCVFGPLDVDQLVNKAWQRGL
jgi:hypothetical protein